MRITIRSVSADELPSFVATLVQLLIETVDDGASLGFLPPVIPSDAQDYWMSLCPELRAGKRVVLGAFSDGQIVGSGQLALPSLPNAIHRAELQKLFVSRSLRGQGVGASLMAALHDCARQRGRTLILLNARRGVADRFYKPLGYREIGVIPGYSLGPDGDRIDSVSLYQDLA